MGHLDKKIVALIAIAIIGISIVVGIIAQSGTNWLYIGDTPNPSVQPTPTPSPTPIPQFVRLETSIDQMQGTWMRSASTGLPIFSTGVNYQVANTGNKDAYDVSISVEINGSPVHSETQNIGSGETKYLQHTFNLKVDESATVYVSAYCPEDQNDYSLSVSAQFPRSQGAFSGDTSFYKLYITPNDQKMQDKASEITTNPLEPNWMEVRDWVSGNIVYKSDSSNHGSSEYWQLPRETLDSRTGDCEDYAILTASLLRAAGWKSDEVYVLVGTANEDGQTVGHAFIKIKILGVWYWCEPQVNSWEMLLFADFNTAKYNIDAEFNDVSFHYGEVS